MEDKPRIVLAGGSGFIGRSLAPMLIERGYEAVVLTRGDSCVSEGIRFLHWDGRTLDVWADALDGAFAVVNLTGKSVNCRHTSENRREILTSRVDSVRVLGEATARCAAPPRVMVQASGIGFYGDSDDRVLDESSPRGEGFMAEVCHEWEGALDGLNLPATRKVILRVGVVLGHGGGALKVLARLARWFLGGAAGGGHQYMSWIHIDDLNRIFAFAAERNDLVGIFNATAPTPATNADFMLELRRVLHRPWSPPVPTPLMRLGARLMGTEADLALQSFRCIPQRLLAAEFRFAYPTLPDALRDLYGLENRTAA